MDDVDPITGERIRTPSPTRGKWISGVPGNGVFQFYTSPINDVAGVSGENVRFSGNHIAVGGFPESWYYRGSRELATVSIARVLGTDVDMDEADKEMKKLMKDENWTRPKGYAWNHAGGEGSTIMELVEHGKGYKHGAVAHKGSAAAPRATARIAINSFGVLTVYSGIQEVAELTKEKYTEVGNHLAAFYDAVDDSTFVIIPGTWFSSPRAVYVGGSRSGQESVLTNEEYKYLETMYHKAFGKFVRGTWFLPPYFVPGTERTTLPAIRWGLDGIYHGYYDINGAHWDEEPCNMFDNGIINL